MDRWVKYQGKQEETAMNRWVNIRVNKKRLQWTLDRWVNIGVNETAVDMWVNIREDKY